MCLQNIKEQVSLLFFLENGTTSELYYYDNGNPTNDSETESVDWKNVGESDYKTDENEDGDQTVKINFYQKITIFSYTISETFD